MFRKILKPTMLGTALLAGTLLSGCESLMYSDVRDKQGISAKEAWSAVDVTAVVTTERANLKKLLGAELDTQDRLAAGIRNHELRSLVAAKTLKEGLVDPVNQRLSSVAGSAESVSASHKRLSNYRKNLILLEAIEEEFKAEHLRMPDCTTVANGAVPPVIAQWLKSADATSASEINYLLEQLQKVCKNPDIDIFAVYAGLSGEIGAAVIRYHAETMLIKEAKDQFEKLRTDYQVALASYNTAVASAKGRSDAAAQVKADLDKLKKAIDALESAQDPFSVQFLSKERLDSLGKFVDAVTQSALDGKIPEGANEATVAFILLPQLLDDAKNSLAAAKKPLALPLLIRRNHEQLKLEAATREIEARETIARLSRELVEVLYEQAVQLWHASDTLGSPSMQKLHLSSIANAFSKSGSNEKEALYRAAAQYLDAVNRLSAKRYKLEYMRIASIHEIGLAYAETNLRQWDSLISATIDQVASASASGIKAENVSALLNSAVLLWIGNGVNK